MVPRWNDQWINEYVCVSFLGGTNDVDLWIDDDGDLRLVKGNGSDGWDYWRLMKDGEVVRLCDDADLTDEEVEQAFIYLNLFVPDWKERMKKVREDYET